MQFNFFLVDKKEQLDKLKQTFTFNAVMRYIILSLCDGIFG